MWFSKFTNFLKKFEFLPAIEKLSLNFLMVLKNFEFLDGFEHFKFFNGF